MVRFQDIKTFPLCPYRCDVDWSSLEFHMQENLETGFLDLNPDFQRAHVWTPEQQISYVEYILRGGASGKELYFNCPDYSKGSTEGPYVIVDGKQRLEAVRPFSSGASSQSVEPRVLISIAVRFAQDTGAKRSRQEVWEACRNHAPV